MRFDGVRKVYNTDQGEIVAVDDFTLKLSEGEVTSLLGRNGAGKTTIMYVCLYINTKYLNRYDKGVEREFFEAAIRQVSLSPIWIDRLDSIRKRIEIHRFELSCVSARC